LGFWFCMALTFFLKLRLLPARQPIHMYWTLVKVMTDIIYVMHNTWICVRTSGQRGGKRWSQTVMVLFIYND
jgi:hypothetical protein